MTTQILGINMPDLILGVPAYTFILMSIIFLVVIISFTVMILLYYYRVYNKRVIVFENVSGQGYQPTGRDRARIIKFGDGGEELLWLRKKKVYRTAYGKKMGKNTYWFAVAPDGYWVNILLGDLDAKMGMLDIEPTSRNMRFMNVANRKNIEERYRSRDLMSKYGVFIISAIFFIIIACIVAYIFSKISKTTESLKQSMTVMQQVASSNEKVLATLDKICGGGLVAT